MKFTVRQGQGDPSGFDLGDMVWRGKFGEADSSGRTPDQGMMIYVSVAQLLDCLRELLQGRTRTGSFTGVDSSFELRFRSTKKGVSVSAGCRSIALVSPGVLARVVASAAEELARERLDDLPADGVKEDFLAALDDFRLVDSRDGDGCRPS
ncbi:hypothetical protein ABZ924_15305 [Streptomyces sp. NPDC046876]|uniref:hypothetical protein n=1 Tax=Streptomyces sp. NPDC046876 TaxID=3155616 RepID=UPI0034088095